MTSPGPETLVRAIQAAGVTDERLLDAVRATPRVDFVPVAEAADAYRDVPVPIGHGQVSTQPSVSAMMIDCLGLDGDEHVLEVGTGYGFQTALLARLAADVVSIERDADLARHAERNLARQGIKNVEVRVGDGSGGVPERAPYDAIVVSAAFPEVPEPLAEQVRPGGRLVQPLGPGGAEEVVCFRRTDEGLEHERVLTGARFVRLRGQYGYPTGG